MFEFIGLKLGDFIKWLFTFKGNDIQILLWGGFVGMLLVFIVEWLRKPKINIDLLPCSYNFNLPNKKQLISKNWKIKVAYKKSVLNKLLFRYSLNNLKVKVCLVSINGKFRKEYQLKADTNPNVYKETDVPSALMGINLTNGEDDLFPFLNYSNEYSWLPFDVWVIFVQQNRSNLSSGAYCLKVTVTSDQTQKIKYFKIHLDDRGNCKIMEMDFFEKLKIKRYDQNIRVRH